MRQRQVEQILTCGLYEADAFLNEDRDRSLKSDHRSQRHAEVVALNRFGVGMPGLGASLFLPKRKKTKQTTNNTACLVKSDRKYNIMWHQLWLGQLAKANFRLVFLKSPIAQKPQRPWPFSFLESYCIFMLIVQKGQAYMCTPLSHTYLLKAKLIRKSYIPILSPDVSISQIYIAVIALSSLHAYPSPFGVLNFSLHCIAALV